MRLTDVADLTRTTVLNTPSCRGIVLAFRPVHFRAGAAETFLVRQGNMAGRRLQHLELMDLNETCDLGAALAGLQGPFSLLSPNALSSRPVSQFRQPECGEEGGDQLGELLPALDRKPARRRPDARRQSTAMFSAFDRATAGVGLLEEGEIAVGDEEIQVPLAKSGKMLGGKNNSSSLFVEPDMEELLENDLPEAVFEHAPPAGEDEPQPQLCLSPVALPSWRRAPCAARTPGGEPAPNCTRSRPTRRKGAC